MPAESTARHTAVEPDETTKGAPERYRAEIRHRRGWAWEVQLITRHVLPYVGKDGEALHRESVTEPSTVLGERWARWKGRRLVAAALKRDVREGQPWAVVRD